MVSAKLCDDGWRPFLDQLRVELTQEGVQVSLGDDPSKLRLSVDANACTDTLTHATLTMGSGDLREVDLSSVAANAKARVLALAAAELVRGALEAKRTTPRDPHTPIDLRISLQSEAPTPAPIVAPTLAAPPALPSFALGLAEEVRFFPETGAGSFGPRVSLSVPLGPLALSVEAAGGVGNAHAPAGDVNWHWFGGALGLATSVGNTWMRAVLGIKMEADYLLFKGNSSTRVAAFSVDSPAVLCALTATSYFALARGVWGVVGLDGGETLYGYSAMADGHVATGVVGPFFSLRMGIAFSPRGP